MPDCLYAGPQYRRIDPGEPGGGNIGLLLVVASWQTRSPGWITAQQLRRFTVGSGLPLT